MFMRRDVFYRWSRPEINNTARVLPYSFVRMTFKARSVAALPKV